MRRFSALVLVLSFPAFAREPVVERLRGASLLQSRPTEVLQAREGSPIVLASVFGDDAAWVAKASASIEKRTRAVTEFSQAAPALTALNAELAAPKGAGAGALIGAWDGLRLRVSWVGGFGVIRVRDGVATRATLPHTAIEDFIRTRKIPAEDHEDLRLNAPHREIVIRALGMKPEVEVESQALSVKKGDRLVVASLGVLTTLPLDLLGAAVSKAKTPEAAAKALVVPGAKAAGAPGVVVLFAE